MLAPRAIRRTEAAGPVTESRRPFPHPGWRWPLVRTPSAPALHPKSGCPSDPGAGTRRGATGFPVRPRAPRWLEAMGRTP
jgi:hypothetical protein